MRQILICAGIAALATGVCDNAHAKSGKASYYKRTSAMITAANEPVGSLLHVTNPQNGKSVRVRVVGSGPFVRGRVLDLSTGAFSQLYGGLGRGVGPVHYRIVSRGGNRYQQARQTKRKTSRHRR